MTQLQIEKDKNQPVNAQDMKPTDDLSVAQFLLRQLEVWGVKRIYGVIGDANLHVLDALAGQTVIQYIACRHECSAALMASAEAKLTGRVGICLATSGPGIANLINGLGDAAMDRAGILAITGQVETSKMGTHTKQYVNQQQLISPLTDKTELLAHPDALPELLQDCLIQSRIFGKVTHLSIPKDLLQAKVKGIIKPYPHYIHQGLFTPEEQVKKAAALIASSQKPLLLVGRGIKEAAEGVKQLAETLQAAVVTTYTAKPLFPNAHGLYAGGLGQAGSEASSMLLAESDLIVILGATWWPDEYTPSQARIVQIDNNCSQMGIGHPLELGVVGDLKQIVPMLVAEASHIPMDRQGWRRRIEEVNGSWKAKIEQEARMEGSPLAPQCVIARLAELADHDAVICVDTGDHTLWFNRIFQAKQQEILISGHWRTLGFGLPAAIAAQLEYPNRQVIALVGDGGCIQTLMEFQTAVQYQLPLVMIIMNNGAYAMEKNRMVVSGLQTLGSYLVNPNFALVAEACGGIGMKAATDSELRTCLKNALEQAKPCLIDVQVEASIVPHTQI